MYVRHWRYGVRRSLTYATRTAGPTYTTLGAADLTRKAAKKSSMSNRKRKPSSSEDEESEYSDVEVDSSGSEEVSPKQDIETGTSGRGGKKRSPKKKKAKEVPKTPPLDKTSFSSMPLLQYVGIRVLQWVLAIVSFATLSNSAVWVDIKTPPAADANYELVSTEKVNNFTTNKYYSPAAKFCDNKVLDGPGSCYRMTVASNFLMATGVLYFMYLTLLIFAQISMYISMAGYGSIAAKCSEKFQVIVSDEKYLKLQIGTDAGWLFFTILSLCVGGTNGDPEWQCAVAFMVFVVWSQIASLVWGVKLYAMSFMVQTDVINDVHLAGSKKSKRGDDEDAGERSSTASGRKKKKTISQAQRERGIIESEDTTRPKQRKSNRSPSSPNVEATLQANLRATHDFPGKTSMEHFRPERDLSFKAGDLLVQFEEIHNGEWYYGCDLAGNKGEFPKNRVEPFTPPVAPQSALMQAPPRSSRKEKKKALQNHDDDYSDEGSED